LLLYSPLKPLWTDEILTYYQVAGKSPGAAISSLDTGFNLLPPGYFALLAAALQLTEFSPLIARGLSSVFIMATVPVMLLILRPHVGRWFAFLAVSVGVFYSPLIFFHNTEARPYGLSLFLTSLVGLACIRTGETKSPATGTLVLLLLVNASIAMTTYFGGLYSAAALAVTLLCDWRIGWFRPRVYAAYVLGWAIFAVTVLPLCIEQLAARGGSGTQWLPPFSYAWRQLERQWAATLWWVLPLSLIVAILLRAAQVRRQRTIEASSTLPEPLVRLAVLSACWLLLPIGAILQSRVTGKNLYFNRYFIGSDLGLIIGIALFLAFLCQRMSGSLLLENVSGARPSFLRISRLIAVGFFAVSAISFVTREAAPQPGAHEAIARADQWNIPKLTFSVGIFVEGFHQPTDGNSYWYIARSEHEAASLARFYPSFQVTNLQHLTHFREFLFVDTNEHPVTFELEAWTRAHNYRIERVHTDLTHHLIEKEFYLVQSAAVNRGQAE